HVFVVPVGLRHVTVVVIGGSGGGLMFDPGAFGAQVTATLAVDSGRRLYVEVGGNGHHGVYEKGAVAPGAKGGANGGGGGGAGVGGGGGHGGGLTHRSYGGGGGGSSFGPAGTVYGVAHTRVPSVQISY